MKSDKHIDYIEKFRKEHEQQIGDYVKPIMKSEKVFSVGCDIGPFAICGATPVVSTSPPVCFS